MWLFNTQLDAGNPSTLASSSLTCGPSSGLAFGAEKGTKMSQGGRTLAMVGARRAARSEDLAVPFGQATADGDGSSQTGRSGWWCMAFEIKFDGNEPVNRSTPLWDSTGGNRRTSHFPWEANRAEPRQSRPPNRNRVLQL